MSLRTELLTITLFNVVETFDFSKVTDKINTDLSKNIIDGHIYEKEILSFVGKYVRLRGEYARLRNFNSLIELEEFIRIHNLDRFYIEGLDSSTLKRIICNNESTGDKIALMWLHKHISILDYSCLKTHFFLDFKDPIDFDCLKFFSDDILPFNLIILFSFGLGESSITESIVNRLKNYRGINLKNAILKIEILPDFSFDDELFNKLLRLLGYRLEIEYILDPTLIEMEQMRSWQINESIGFLNNQLKNHNLTIGDPPMIIPDKRFLIKPIYHFIKDRSLCIFSESDKIEINKNLIISCSYS